MNTHDLALVLDDMKVGLDRIVKSDVKTAFASLADALRELPNQKLSAFVAAVRAKPMADGRPRGGGAKATKAAADVPQLIERIRRVRDNAEPADDLSAVVESLTDAQLREVLAALGETAKKGKPNSLAAVRALVAPNTPNGSADALRPSVAIDTALVDRGVQLYRRLWDDPNVSIHEIRTQFAPVMDYPKPILEEISRQLEYTPFGTAGEIARRLLSNLEELKVSQQKGRWILSGT